MINLYHKALPRMGIENIETLLLEEKVYTMIYHSGNEVRGCLTFKKRVPKKTKKKKKKTT